LRLSHRTQIARVEGYVVKRLEPDDPNLVRWHTLDEDLSADHRMVLNMPRQEVSLDDT